MIWYVALTSSPEFSICTKSPYTPHCPIIQIPSSSSPFCVTSSCGLCTFLSNKERWFYQSSLSKCVNWRAHEIQRRYQILVTRILSRESKTSSNSSKCMTRYVFHVSYILFYFNSTLDFVLCLLETCWRLFWSRVIHSHSLLRFVILKQWLGCGVRAKLHVDKSVPVR